MGFNKRRFTLKYEKVGEISRRLVVVILMGIGGDVFQSRYRGLNQGCFFGFIIVIVFTECGSHI